MSKIKIEKQTCCALLLTLLLFLTIFTTMVTLPTANAKTNIRSSSAGMSFSYSPIGVNQTVRITAIFANQILGYESGDILPGAYVNYIRPDGTNFTKNDPIKYSWFPGDGSTSYTEAWEFTPDQVGIWTIELVWPGDANYNPYTVKNQLVVQQEAITLQRQSNGMLSIRPNPIGLGQDLLINAWTTPRPLCIGEFWQDQWITLIKPDGTSEKLGPFSTFREGSFWLTYPMDQLGNWTIQFTWAGDIYNTPVDVKREVTVQEQQIPSWPPAPLPTEQWTFPIWHENREWVSISGPWLHAWRDTLRTSWNLYSQAPRSSHILFALPPMSGLGGIIGGEYGTGGYYDVDPIPFGTGTGGAILGGKGYWTGDGNIHCFDMRTGEELWKVPGSFDFAAIENGQPELVSTSTKNLLKYDALTGKLIANITGIIGSSFRNFDVSTVDTEGGYVIDFEKVGNTTYIVKWSFFGNEANFTNRIAWRVPYPFEGEDPTNVRGATIEPKADVVSWITYPVYGESGALNYSTGELLWKKRLHGIQARNAHGVYDGKLYYPTDDRAVIAIDLKTGEQVWKSEQTAYPWGANFAYSHASAYGNIYKLTYAGIYAFNASDGKIVWHYTAGDSGLETPYTTWPFYDNIVGADGVLFATTTEHTPTPPYYRGQGLYAVDAYNGKLIWKIKGTIAPAAIAEGTLLASSLYDGKLYAFSKGETEITLSVSSKVVAKGSSVLIEGTITDQSPAQKGTPAVSEESMSAWMEYLHMQQPKPTNTTGVNIKLTAIGADGKVVDIDTVTSDADGIFKKLWTPTVEGEYTIVATFEGSPSYWPSHAATAIGVSPAAPTSSTAPSVTSTPSAPLQSPTVPTSSPAIPTAPVSSPTPAAPGSETTIPLTTYIAVVAVAIVIATVVVAFTLKRRTK